MIKRIKTKENKNNMIKLTIIEKQKKRQWKKGILVFTINNEKLNEKNKPWLNIFSKILKYDSIDVKEDRLSWYFNHHMKSMFNKQTFQLFSIMTL